MSKVLCVGNHFYPRGGSDQYMMNLFRLLTAKLHEVVPFSSKHELNEPSIWSTYFPEYIDTNKWTIGNGRKLIYSGEARRNIKRLLSDVEIDVAHLNIFSQFSASILEPLKQRGIPIVQTLHDYKPLCPTYSLYRNGQLCEECATKGALNAIRHKCNRGSSLRTIATVAETYFSRYLGSLDAIDHFITVSEFQRKKLLGYDTLKGKKITTIPNFVDTNIQSKSDRQGDYLFYFGRLEKTKGVWTLIKAMESLNEFKLILAGEGLAKKWLEKYVSEKKLNHITFLPYQNQESLTRLISESYCTVLPSEVYELCPMSILESLALNKMVIGADIGGIPELIRDNESGLLFKPGDINALREKIIQAFSNKAKSREMGLAGRAYVEEYHTADKHYESLMEVYSSLK